MPVYYAYVMRADSGSSAFLSAPHGLYRNLPSPFLLFSDNGYEAKLRIFLADGNARLADDRETRDLAFVDYKIHSTLDNIWWAFDTDDAANSAYHISSQRLAIAAIKVAREGNAVKAWYTLDPDAGEWEEVRNASLFVPLPNFCAHDFSRRNSHHAHHFCWQ